MFPITKLLDLYLGQDFKQEPVIKVPSLEAAAGLVNPWEVSQQLDKSRPLTLGKSPHSTGYTDLRGPQCRRAAVCVWIHRAFASIAQRNLQVTVLFLLCQRMSVGRHSSSGLFTQYLLILVGFLMLKTSFFRVVSRMERIHE
jgi:hypothetical protein